MLFIRIIFILLKTFVSKITQKNVELCLIFFLINLVYVKISGIITEPKEGEEAEIVKDRPFQVVVGDDIETEELVYVHWVSIYKKSKDSLIKTMDIDFYKKYKDSIKLKTKDTLVNIGIDEYLIKPFVPKPVWKASAYLYTNTDGYTILKVPEFGKHQYKVIFKEENGTDIFTLHKVLDSYLLIDKSNFPHAGWFFYEMYQDDVLFEKNKFFIESDF